MLVMSVVHTAWDQHRDSISDGEVPFVDSVTLSKEAIFPIRDLSGNMFEENIYQRESKIYV